MKSVKYVVDLIELNGEAQIAAAIKAAAVARDITVNVVEGAKLEVSGN